MKGTFRVTIEYLKELGACREGQREFQRVFPEGGEYQEVLDRCAEENRIDFAAWLFEKIGPTEDVRIFEKSVFAAEKSIFFAGQLEFKGSASVKRVFAGWGIKAGEGIEAGEDYCIFAGVKIKKSLWEVYAVVSAKEHPLNLCSGFWKQKDNGEGT